MKIAYLHGITGDVCEESERDQDDNGLVDPLEFWLRRRRENDEMKGLTSMALDIFSCPSAGVDVERMFSAAGRYVTPLRHNLRADTISYLTSLGNWFKEGFIDIKAFDKFCK